MSEKPLLYPGAHAAHSPEKPAVIMAETGDVLSYGALDTFANRLGRLYQWLGLKPGDHVAYCLENRLECPAVQWGAHYAGLYYTFISTRLTGAEAAYIVEDCEAQVLVVSAKTAPAVIEAVRALPSPPQIYSLDPVAGIKLFDDALSAFDGSPIRDAVEGSEMLYSSGTTGRPKGVKPVLSGLPLGSTGVIAGLMQRGFGVGLESVYFSPSPYYHAAPMKWGQGMTSLGGTLVLAERFDAEGALKAVERYRVSHSQWVPTMFHRMLALPREVRERYDLSSQKVAVHAGAPCAVPTKLEMIRWWGPILIEFYSCTETIGSTMVDSKTWLERPGTVGHAVLGELHILDEDGRELPPGQDGLVYFANGPRFSYHKAPEKTREAYNDKGWATVGDIGHVDEDGFLFLTDRKNNMIISGGVNVYPQETENVLATHPKVFDVAVIGTPHSDLGEEVRAVVQLEPGVEASDALREELVAFCREQLSPIKCPRAIDFVDSLPREPNGKLLKRLLRDEYRARLA
ncbi:acyl-CoA synthetase [Pseudomonas sp. 273]|uniref:acyl-CoA synthetase n=1 Tax=Pseudomonas TaxID=286 RepID=UPI0023D84166|nr:acyl-CoA synthetase [Pseudomonas sp. 273]